MVALLAVGAGALRAQEPAPAPAPPGDPGSSLLRPDTAGAGAVAAAIARRDRAAVVDAGPGAAGRRLRDALAGPHLLIVAPDSGLVLGRAVQVASPLVVVGSARVAATVRGDLFVLGDLYLRPGAAVAGDAIAIGGQIMVSSLDSIAGRTLAYDAVRFTSSRGPDGSLALAVRPLDGRASTSVVWPGYWGVRIPGYTRIDGLVLSAGPEVRLDTGRVRIEPVLTYRSHLGVLDPGVRVGAELSRRTSVDLTASRGTFSNDSWIRGDPLNSVIAFSVGLDARNYWRADRGELAVRRRYETERHVVEPFVGAVLERSWSAARDSGAASAPYSLLRRGDPEGIRRANPAVTGGRIASAVLGARWRTEGDQSNGDVVVRVEQGVSVGRGSRFTQGTFDAEVALPGFSDHRIRLFAHGVGTLGGAVPSQRYAYLGGSGTIPSQLLLEQGGDQLLWVETRYTIPMRVVNLPFVGPPAVTLRHIVGGAGVDRLPALTQNLGVRLNIALLRVDYTFDPTGRGRRDFSVGVGLR